MRWLLYRSITELNGKSSRIGGCAVVHGMEIPMADEVAFANSINTAKHVLEISQFGKS